MAVRLAMYSLVAGQAATQDAPLKVDASTVEIMHFDVTTTGAYHRPKPFGGIGKPVDQTGYSDHFPIGVRVTVADRPADARLPASLPRTP